MACVSMCAHHRTFSHTYICIVWGCRGFVKHISLIRWLVFEFMKNLNYSAFVERSIIILTRMSEGMSREYFALGDVIALWAVLTEKKNAMLYIP